MLKGLLAIKILQKSHHLFPWLTQYSVMAAGRGPARTGNEASPLAAGDRRRGRARCGFGAEGASGGGGRRLVRGRGGILPRESRLKSRVQVFRMSASEFSLLALLV